MSRNLQRGAVAMAAQSKCGAAQSTVRLAAGGTKCCAGNFCGWFHALHRQPRALFRPGRLPGRGEYCRPELAVGDVVAKTPRRRLRCVTASQWTARGLPARFGDE